MEKLLTHRMLMVLDVSGLFINHGNPYITVYIHSILQKGSRTVNNWWSYKQLQYWKCHINIKYMKTCMYKGKTS